MTKRRSTPSPANDTPDSLIKPKAQFEKELNEQIDKGNELLVRQVIDGSQLSKLNQDYDYWNTYNAELISRAFVYPENKYWREYTHSPVSIGIASSLRNSPPSLPQLIQKTFKKTQDHINILKKLQQRLPLIDELSGLYNEPSPEKENIQEASLRKLSLIFSRFHKVAQSLRDRHNDRETIIIQDEYDVQDLLRSLLKVYFDDVREEDSVSQVAGASSRVDFVLKAESIVIEVKMTNDRLKDKELGSQLLIDMGRYTAHPDCKVLVIFIYDKGDYIRNKAGLTNDLENLSSPNLTVKVFINPK